MIPSVITFNLDQPNSMVVFGFLGPYWAIFGVGIGFKNVLGSTQVVEQLSFSMILSILTIKFDLIFKSFLNFLGPNGLFLRSCEDSKLFRIVLMKLNNFYFLCFLQF